MAEKYICNECGSETINWDKDVSSFTKKESMKVPAYCSNRSCPNADPRNHSFQWARLADESK